MFKNSFYLFFTALFFGSLGVFAQDTTEIKQHQDVDNFYFYPNPVTEGKIYFHSKSKLDKEIEIFDVLGYTVLETKLIEKELDVSNLTPGVYIIKIKEAGETLTRKLIIK